MATNRVAGTCFFQIDGQLQAIRGSWSWMGSLAKREGIASNDLTVAGYKETPLVPYIEGDIIDLGDVSATDISLLDGATITLETANGKVITLIDAWCCGELKVETEEGKFTARFEGLSLLEA